MARAMLEKLGFTVLSAHTPEEALAAAQHEEHNIALVITDVVMPGMTGRELSHKINEITPGLKCLYMSGYTADVVADRGILHDDVAFLQKPFSLDQLGKRVQELLGT
jgi:CheY-like chemotaxis protein